ncbi:MAG: CGNR zinc finger domain-containing protein [Micrococcales bacterium]|nr:CGNR zinc finger domain-containing protein [Micrococcales bacterium]
MPFTHDTTTTLASAAALVNSSPRHTVDGSEELPTVAALNDFLAAHDWSYRARRRADVTAVHAFRERLERLWPLPVEALAEEVNGLFREHEAIPELVNHGDFGWHFHATRPGAPLAASMAVEIALAISDLIRLDEAERLRVCAGSDCTGAVIDFSRNRSRRFCDQGCGNRANVAAYRARQSGHDDGPTP